MLHKSMIRKSRRSSSLSPSSSSACLLSPLRVVLFLGMCLAALTHYHRLLLLQSSSLHQHRLALLDHDQVFSNQRSALAVTASNVSSFHKKKQEKCAILFYGLPRAFSLVLPSIQQNIIHVNRQYGCDYFVHYYNQTVEMAGRSGQGGNLEVNEILRLATAVALESLSAATAVVRFASDTNETFYASHADIIHEILTAKDETGRRPLYYPWMERDFAFPQSMLNILKMMHSMEQAWQLMQGYGAAHDVTYSRVALLRADVVFLTPIDIWNAGSSNSDKDVHNAHVVIPSFARYPVNDRGIYGNAAGVRIWATGRFDAMARHVQAFRGSGFVMHNERFVDSVILPAIRQQAGLTVVEHDAWCFCRARVGQRVWLNDCTKGSTSGKLKRTFPNTQALVRAVEHAVNATCGDVQSEGVSGALSVHCH